MEQHTNKEVERLLTELKRRHDWTINWRTAEELVRLGQAAVPHLIEALSDEDGYVRAAAADALGEIRDERAVKALAAAMQYRDNRIYEDDEDAEARNNAAEALGKIGDLRAFDDLIHAASGKDLLLASYAVDALGMLGDERAIPTLLAALKVADLDLPKAACSALKRIGTPAVLPLIEALDTAKGYWRVYALKALGSIGDPRALASINALLNDADQSVRSSAAKALQQLHGSQSPGADA